MKTKKKYLNNQRGFTLLEMLVVIIMIGLLASLVAPKLFNKLGTAKVKTTGAQLSMIDTALDAFRLDVGRYPTQQEGLMILWSDPGNLKVWDGPYLPKPVKADAWGNPYQYKCPGEGNKPYDVISLGADGRLGGAGDDADLSVWN